MKRAKISPVLVLLALWLAACAAAPTAAPTPDPPPALETLVAATLEAAHQATLTAAAPLPTPSPQPSQAPVNPDAFTEELQRALAARDFAALSPLLSDPFELALWQSQSGHGQIAAAEAVAVLRSELLASRVTVTFSDQLPAGVEAGAPEGRPIRQFFSRGWGPDGFGEAVLTVAEGPDGGLAWRSLLVAPIGFNPPPPAAVAGVINVASANLRTGPSPLHTLVAPYAMGTRMIVAYAAPGYRWGKVTAPDGQEGWLLLSLLDLEAPPESLPLYPGVPSDSIPIIGWVEGGSGQPIDRAVVSVWQTEDETNRPLAFTGADGMFYLYLPANSTGNWTVGVLSVDCASSVMDEQCARQAEFAPLKQTITLPRGKPVIFVYNNILSATPAPAAQGCPPAESGKLPLNNAQDHYCLLYPEGFTILQPATNVLEIVGPALNQEEPPLTAKVTIQKKPLPPGSTLETVAAALWGGAKPGFSQDAVTVGGEPGRVGGHLETEGLPYQVRQVVVIYQDSYYILTFAPWDDQAPYSAALSDQQKLWDTLMPSFRFTP